MSWMGGIDPNYELDPFGKAQRGQKMIADVTSAISPYQTTKMQTEAQKEIARGQQDIARGQLETSRQGQQLQYNAAVLPEQLKQQRFSQIFPLLQGQLGNMGTYATPGGTPFAPTPISNRNPWSPQMTAQAVGAGRAQSQRQLGTQLRGIGENLAARGYAANSPLYMSLGGAAQARSLAGSMANERAIRQQAAQANVARQTQVDQLREQQRQAMEEADIKRRTPFLGQQSQLWQALAGLV